MKSSTNVGFPFRWRWFLTFALGWTSAWGAGGDWPQWLGPQRDGVYTGRALSPTFPKDGPIQKWKRNVGQGFSGPVVEAERVILFHRVRDEEFVECLESSDGRTIWKNSYPTTYVDSFGFDEGPRATPLIHEGIVYTFGAEGILQALHMAHGKRMWRIDTQEKFNAPKGFFGRACSPMIEGDSLILNVGGRDGAGIVAFDKRRGDILWQATHAEASYSSPTSGTIHGRRYSFFFNREGLVALDPTNGHVYFEFPWRPESHASVNAASPLMVGDLIFLSTSYGRGATVLKFNEGAPRKLWASDDVLSNHYATSVHHKGYLYGFHGRQEEGCLLRCVAFQTGEIMWNQDGLKSGSILLEGDQLWILTESGELISAPATPKQFKPTGRAQILGFSTRAYPAIANGHLYGRDKNQLVCIQLAN